MTLGRCEATPSVAPDWPQNERSGLMARVSVLAQAKPYAAAENAANGDCERLKAKNADAMSDDMETTALNVRYIRHCGMIETAEGKARLWHMAMARGLYSILVERALAGDDKAAYGAPHWLLYSNEQMKQMA